MGHSNMEGKQAARWRPLPFVFCYFHREFRPFDIWALSKSRSIEHFNQLTVINYSSLTGFQPNLDGYKLFQVSTHPKSQPIRHSTLFRYRPTHILDKFRISALPDFNPIKPSRHSVFRQTQSLDLFRILTSRDFDQLGPTTHLESRHIQNFDL
ncbi:hypothetical protein M513_05583 [Trichuris suis]|uniref:Uncharacterized protein n=1 Tax=Trichuris suis TaxID=68888 RepID=A0A085M8D1_9BILA|nr:hypothetical protein M513_05583 [Trichuris suis]